MKKLFYLSIVFIIGCLSNILIAQTPLTTNNLIVDGGTFNTVLNGNNILFSRSTGPAYIWSKNTGGYLSLGTNGRTEQDSNANLVLNADLNSFFNGNVGIGTTNPQQKLQIGNNGFTLHDGGHKVLTFNPNTTNFGSIRYDVPNKRFTIETIVDGSLMTHMHIKNTGLISINNQLQVGSVSNFPNGYKLAIAGKLITEEVKVQLQSNWSDFVFEKDYNLPTLNQVENHIKEKGHLKDIPSAKEVEKNGIFLGEMDAKLLQKIEELTLYTIKQEKSLENKDLKIKNLEEKLELQEARLKKIELLLASKN